MSTFPHTGSSQWKGIKAELALKLYPTPGWQCIWGVLRVWAGKSSSEELCGQVPAQGYQPPRLAVSGPFPHARTRQGSRPTLPATLSPWKSSTPLEGSRKAPRPALLSSQLLAGFTPFSEPGAENVPREALCKSDDLWVPQNLRSLAWAQSQVPPCPWQQN